MTVDGRTWLEIVTPPECWDLLAQHQVGRVAVMGDRGPEIYPVNYVVDGRTIVFRTDRGTTLAGLLRWSSVAFEIDEIDRADRTGWSVLVKGDAREVTSPDQLATLRARPLDVWRVGEAPRWIRVVPAEVTGRRLLRWGGPSREPSALTGA